MKEMESLPLVRDRERSFIFTLGKHSPTIDSLSIPLKGVGDFVVESEIANVGENLTSFFWQTQMPNNTSAGCATSLNYTHIS